MLKFDGWLKIYPSKFTENILPILSENETLDLKELKPEQHFTEPPPRYNEASLIKAMEEHGIGRPSTYAPTIATIQARNYVAKNEQRRFVPTETGNMVNDLLVLHFPQIVDINFTAKMEEDLDRIAEGQAKWVPIIKRILRAIFTQTCSKKSKRWKKGIWKKKLTKSALIAGNPWSSSMADLEGLWPAPAGRNARPPNQSKTRQRNRDEMPQMRRVITRRPRRNCDEKTRKGRVFYGCSRYPKCDYASWKNPSEKIRKWKRKYGLNCEIVFLKSTTERGGASKDDFSAEKYFGL